MDSRAVGVFDSGFGGVSVLRDAIRLMPNEDFIFFGDHANLPYGDKTPEQIRSLSFIAAGFLAARNVKAILIACNTATSAAIKDIRAEFNLPVISMEPAVKPACEGAPPGGVLVMATQATIDQRRYQELVRLYDKARRVSSVPCPGLADTIERLALSGTLQSADAEEIIGGYLAPFHGTRVSAIVLGCTHYIFLRKQLEAYARKHFPGTLLFDGNLGTVRQLMRVLGENGLEAPEKTGKITFHSSGGGQLLLDGFHTLLRM